MTILILLALLCAVCALAVENMPYQGDGLEVILVTIFALCGMALLISVISIPINRMGCRDQLAQIEAVRNTKPLSEVQDAAWRMKAADANAQLASMKYWNHTAFDIWTPDEVDSVEPLQ